MTTAFGRALRPLWGLAPDAVFLNHGSFGACPLEVLRAQDEIRARMEAQPDLFFQEQAMPQAGGSGLRTAAAEVARFVNAQPDSIAFVENASAGIQAILRSVKLEPGDKILVTDHTYNAMRLMVDAKCAETGATPIVVTLPIPADADEIVRRFAAALTPAVKMALVDHITSPTALVLPLGPIIADLRRNGTLVLVDGAHAVGQIPLDIVALAPDWYVSNCHKWLFAPKGSAFLYAAKTVAALTQPNIISHYTGLGFPLSFDYTGTRDNSAWLATPAALNFLRTFGPEDVHTYQRHLITFASQLLQPLGATPVADMKMCAAMRSFILPQRRAAKAEDAEQLARALWDQGRIQAFAIVLGDKLLMRISAQIYVDEPDMARLAQTLERLGWPGRR